MILIRSYISIHAPREGGDIFNKPFLIVKRHFNPRPPRGGRRTKVTGYNVFTTISIHAPREGGDKKTRTYQQKRDISIHAPREGGDALSEESAAVSQISIHAPREGGDNY